MRFREFAWMLLLLVLVAGLLWGCSRNRDPDGAAAPAGGSDAAADTAGADAADAQAADEDDEEPVPVDVAVLARGPIESVLRASANLEAESQVAVVSEAARRVTELLVEEGDRVRRGQLLLRLQDDEQRSAVARTETELARAQREFDRQEKLHAQDLTTDQALNDASDELNRRRLAQQDASRELSYTQVRAPFAGTITSRRVNLGNQVQVGQQLFDIVDFESLVARIYVPEKNLKELRTGLPARITAGAIREEPFMGSVKRIAPVVDARTGTVKVTIDVGGQEGLRPGLYVDVELVTAVNENALLVPKRALVYDNDQIFLYRLEPGRRVSRLLVVPTMADRDHVAPLRGLAEGDSIVVAGQAGLKDGARVSLPGDEEEADEEAEKLTQEATQ